MGCDFNYSSYAFQEAIGAPLRTNETFLAQRVALYAERTKELRRELLMQFKALNLQDRPEKDALYKLMDIQLLLFLLLHTNQTIGNDTMLSPSLETRDIAYYRELFHLECIERQFLCEHGVNIKEYLDAFGLADDSDPIDYVKTTLDTVVFE